MGQKVNPTGFRLGISKKQNANWYAKGKDFSTYLIRDLKVREYFKTKLKNSLVFGHERIGRGNIVYFVDNVMFRSFWENGKMFLANSVFYIN